MLIPERRTLILTDNDQLARSLGDALAVCELEPVTIPTVEDAISHLESDRPALVLADLDLEDGDAAEFVAQTRRTGSSIPLLLLVSENSVERAETAMRNGGTWFLKKPISAAEMKLAVDQLGRVERQTSAESETAVYGSSPQIQSVLKVVAQAACSNAPVTITGEPGTGKRLVARMIHEGSSRSRAPFMQFNGNGMSESVVDCELFGIDDDPDSAGLPQQGCLSLCKGGTLLIDEIEWLPISVQAKVFVYLQPVAKTRVLGASDAPDLRVIASSSRDLEEWVGEGRIHAGLAGLLGGIRADLPPLRDRKSDIPILVDHFSRRAARRIGRTLRGIEPDALRRLMQYDWSGNVRELKDLIEHAVHSATDTLLRVEDLPSLPESANPQPVGFRPGATIQEIEKEVILRTLESTGGSTGRAAKLLNISVRKIQYKLKEYREEAGAAPLSGKGSVAVPQPQPVRRHVFVAGAQKRDS